MTTNDKGEEIQTRLSTKWRVCIDYQKLNVTTKKDHFPLKFIDQILDKLFGQGYYCFLDGYFGYKCARPRPGDARSASITIFASSLLHYKIEHQTMLLLGP